MDHGENHTLFAARRCASLVVLIALCAAPTRAAAQDLSIEVRMQTLTPSQRISHSNLPPDQPFRFDREYYEESLYLTPGVGVRAFTDGERGLLVDFEYRYDLDLDSRTDEDQLHPVHMRVAHVGYARRYVRRSTRRPDRRAISVTPHASLTVGRFVNESESTVPREDVGESGAILGVRGGVDLDIHIERFFFGAALAYEFLWHPGSALRVSQVFSWSALPFLRFGVNFGRRVQAVGRARAPSAPSGRAPGRCRPRRSRPYRPGCHGQP